MRRAQTIAGVEPQEIDVLLPFADRVQLPANQLVFSQGDATDNFYLLEHGCVRVFYTSWNGKEITFFNCRAGDLFGLAEAFSLSQRSASAQTVEQSVAWAIDSRGLSKIAHKAPRFMLRVAEAISYRLHSVAINMESVVAVPLRVRVASYLLANTDSHSGTGIQATSTGLTHETMANLVGCSRQTLTKVLNEFARAGFISIERKRIVMLDAKGLRDHADMATFEL